jgi:hypothetical protein
LREKGGLTLILIRDNSPLSHLWERGGGEGAYYLHILLLTKNVVDSKPSFPALLP